MNVIVDVKKIVMIKNLTTDKLKTIYDGKSNLADKPIIIDFYADWCGPCKMFEPIFEEVANEYKDRVDFYKVNSEQEQEISIMFNVRSIPTVAMISKKGDLTSNPGAMTVDTFKYYIEGLISKN
jgi:thioredoxin